MRTIILFLFTLCLHGCITIKCDCGKKETEATKGNSAIADSIGRQDIFFDHYNDNGGIPYIPTIK